MADSEKVDSSNGKAKGKLSLIADDDISKDFLGSWKSKSMTGGDDMDFNFEPVSKGNKKQFNFDKLDMDFSLDREFGNMSSFKIDMPDLDFSSSPKKSTKSKEKSEDQSGKGNHCLKNDDFSFSFDFNGMDAFSLDAPSSKGGNSHIREKISKEAEFDKEIECGNMTRQAAKDNGKVTEVTASKKPPASEHTVNSSSKDLMGGKGNFDISFEHCSLNSTSEVDMLQPEKSPTDNAQETDHQNPLADKTSLQNSSAKGNARGTNFTLESIPSHSKPTSSPALVDIADAKVSLDSEKTSNAMVTDEEIQAEKTIFKPSCTELLAKDLSAKSPLVKKLTHSIVSEEMEVCSLNENPNDASEVRTTYHGEFPAAAVLTANPGNMNPNKYSLHCSTDKKTNDNEDNETMDFDSSGSGKLTCYTAGNSATNVPATLGCETLSNPGTQKAALKVFSGPFGSGSTLAKPMLVAYKVPGPFDSKFSRVRNAKAGDGANLSSMERKSENSTHLSNEGRSNKDVGKKLNDNLNSCTKELVNRDSVSKSTEKITDADTSSREGNNDANEKMSNVMGVDGRPQDRQAIKDGCLMPGIEKTIKDTKPSGFLIPLHALSGRESKSSQQDSSKFKDMISSSAPIQKLTISEGNKLPSLTTGKKLPGLPSSKFPMNATASKRSASPAVGGNAKSMGTFQNRLQALSKIGHPISSDKQKPSTPSLKRKPFETADESTEVLPPSKRLSPGESRMFKGLSGREAEDEVHTKGTLSEGSEKNVTGDPGTSKFDFHQDASMEDMGFTLLLESDANVEKAEACAKELDDICNMLKKKHEEAKELLVRALVNNNNLLMLNHPIHDEKIRAVQRFADRLMSKELKAGA